MKRHNCQARQYGDQMICAPCGLNWDVNDPDDVAVEMVKTYQAHGGHSAGMQAAYRLFLDRMEP